VRHYVEQGRSPNTMRAYRGDVKRFVAWCDEGGYASLPANAEVVSAYLAHLADSGKRSATIGRALAGIAKAHDLAGHASPAKDPLVRATLAGIKRVIGTKSNPVKPLLVDDIRKLVDVIPGDVRGDRDKALLLVGFTGAFRRSELVAIDLRHMIFSDKGLLVLIPKSKTDQEAQGQHVAIPFAGDERYCPVRAAKHWMTRAKIEREVAGPLFRKVVDNHVVDAKGLSAQTVKDIAKRWAKRAGIDPAKVAGHSLRAGYATSGALAGANVFQLQSVTRHADVKSLQRYVRIEDLFANSPTKGLL